MIPYATIGTCAGRSKPWQAKQVSPKKSAIARKTMRSTMSAPRAMTAGSICGRNASGWLKWDEFVRGVLFNKSTELVRHASRPARLPNAASLLGQSINCAPLTALFFRRCAQRVRLRDQRCPLRATCGHLRYELVGSRSSYFGTPRQYVDWMHLRLAASSRQFPSSHRPLINRGFAPGQWRSKLLLASAPAGSDYDGNDNRPGQHKPDAGAGAIGVQHRDHEKEK